MVVYSNRHNIIDILIASFHWYRFSFDRIASSASLSIILFYHWFSLGRFSLIHSFTFFFCIIIYLQHLCYHSISCFHPRSFWLFHILLLFPLSVTIFLYSILWLAHNHGCFFFLCVLYCFVVFLPWFLFPFLLVFLFC